jgi:hypothetical protein
MVSTIHPGSSVSMAQCPRRASSSSTVDFPVPDMPVNSTAALRGSDPADVTASACIDGHHLAHTERQPDPRQETGGWLPAPPGRRCFALP